MEEPEQQCRRTVFLDRSHLRLALKRGELHVSDVPYVATRLTRHFPRLLRQHQQPAHDECDLQSWPTPRRSEAFWKRDAWTRQYRQQTTERLRAARRSTGAVLREAKYRLLTACAQRRC